MKFETFPIIETERFLLRQMTKADAPAVFSIFSDPDVTKDMGEAPFTQVKQAELLIEFMNGLFDEDRAIRWGIILKEENTLIGTCGYNGWETNRGSRGEIAYDLGKPHWRKGYMTEVIQSLITFGFESMGLYRIEAFTNVDATPSMQLLKKNGFQEDGILRGYACFHGEYVDQRCFSLLQKDWQ
ncbi:GNAT family protein [Brevibacillus choshinensis]|uniref:GNAT family N-acetyltransferase n=2 Tax=Brevibacillus choshinensis TaxID=54911 RepID=UPI002E1E1F22|nr:GNAT family protein [Brevibacillus choshinensis]MED4750888.1 GNAT family protein [Brevibacillus choshinensis]MED4783016.1 GNAT family protein [Brevibacillus choshinensis]